MREKTGYLFAFFLGTALVFLSVYLYQERSLFWFYPAPIGAWLFFATLAWLRKRDTALKLVLENKWRSFIIFYATLFIFGLLLEIVGSMTLHLWSYKLAGYTPTFHAILTSEYKNPLSALGWFIYPFMLMQFEALYELTRSFVGSALGSTLISMAFGILLWEIPNVHSHDWVYSIPFVHAQILGVNIVVIIGWVLLIQAPVQIYKSLET